VLFRSIRAINTVLKFKFPEEKSVRISPVQKNTYNIKANPEEKQALIKGILENLKVNDKAENQS
jgi:hypothetical protein